MKQVKLFFLFVFCFYVSGLKAQVIDVKQKAKDDAVYHANKDIDQGIEKGLNSIENGVKGLFKKKKSTEADTKTKDGKQEVPPENKTQEAVKETKPGTDTNPGLAAYSQFDFTPGQKVIFFDDFSQDNKGDFPALWFSDGSGEVVTMNNYPGKWLNITAKGCYFPERDLQTTENFTVEFDMIFPAERFNVLFYLVSGNVKNPGEGGAIPGKAGVRTEITNHAINYSGYADGVFTLDGGKDDNLAFGKIVHFSYWVQKQRLRIYVNEKKEIDVPRIMPAGYKFNILRFEVGDEDKPFISNFRVAAGAPDTRNKLITEGKLVTYGIYFDVNSDKVKPESYGTLKEIAGVLNEVPDVKVKIFGHTDSDGDDAKNMDLSKRRAASVKAELAKTFGVKAERLETDGMGETKPVAPNDTPANKALNRRVEFIKL